VLLFDRHLHNPDAVYERISRLDIHVGLFRYSVPAEWGSVNAVGRRSSNHASRGEWRKELEERETSCGWTSLDRLRDVSLGGVPCGYIAWVDLWPELRQRKRVFESGGGHQRNGWVCVQICTLECSVFSWRSEGRWAQLESTLEKPQ
jgi:hypothetical protein